MKKILKNTLTVLAAVTVLFVSGASFTANAACQYHHGTYIQGQYIDNCHYKDGCWRCKCCNQPVACPKHHGTYVNGRYISNKYRDRNGNWRCKCCNSLV